MTKAEYIGTAVKSPTWGIYDLGKNGDCKTCHGSPHDSSKGGINKGGNYMSTYAPRTYSNTTSKG